MKKIFTSLILIVIIALTFTPVHAQGHKPPAQGEIPPRLNGYNGQITSILARLGDHQFDYYVGHGRYYQALRSHVNIPTEDTFPDKINHKPTDQDEDLSAFWNNGLNTIPFAITIDVYSGPDGDGYTLTATADVDGTIWMKSINVGPETWRDHDWRDQEWEEVTTAGVQ